MQDEEWDDDDDGLDGADYGKGEFDYLSCEFRVPLYHSGDL
jgi:hypothetical protein